ncbi:MAG: T9SS type A sorting domain-containing protein [Crocinitomicaceae bacterium]
MRKHLLFMVALLVVTTAKAQLPDGSTAPDFTLTDRDGVEHNLYTYLNQGKAVFLKFFACHCPSCWAYHNTRRLDSLYDSYGPNGTDQVMVLMLEHDQNNPEAFTGGGSYTQGDWTIDNSVPMIDVEGTDRTVFDDYNLNYYPMVIKVCSDKKTELMSTGYDVAELYQEAHDCPGALGIETFEDVQKIYVDQVNKLIKWSGFEQIKRILAYNVNGQEVLNYNGNTNGSLNVAELKKGIYVVRIEHSEGVFTKKIMLQ